MKRRIITIIATLAVIAATLCMGLALTACDTNKANSYTFIVTYEDGTPVNGLTDGNAGVTADGGDGTEVQVQICAANPDTHVTGFCNAPKAIGADGKVEFKNSELNASQLKDGEKWHVQINGKDDYTYDEDIYLDGYKEYTIVLKAKN